MDDESDDGNLEEGKRLRDEGMQAALDASDPRWKAAWKLYVFNLPTGWTDIGEAIRFALEAMPYINMLQHSEQSWGGMMNWAKKVGLLKDTLTPGWKPRTAKTGHASGSKTVYRTDLRVLQFDGDEGNRRMDVSFDLGERIKQVREMEAFLEKQQEELDAKYERHHKFVETGRAEILAFLNQTNQKSANTEFGGCHWKPKITYRVEDKDAFRRHVIGAEAWELITWAAGAVNCEAFTAEHKMPPPGLVRNAVNILYITPPTKPKGKNKVVNDDGAT
jgi:hypothetical protein